MATKFIWTHHALERLDERRIPRKYIDQALHKPDRTILKEKNTFEMQKRIDRRTVAAIIKKSDDGAMLVISCWINPPFPGTKDHRKRQRYLAMQKASPLKKIWLTLLNQLGL